MPTFDDAAASRLERMYATPSVVQQRARTRGAAGVRRGMDVLDVGCGPGLLAVELARDVGPEGSVLGIDASPDMVTTARRLASGAGPDAAPVDFRVGDAAKLDCADASVDVVTCTQVYEYVPDVLAALRDAGRVLRPGGRLAVVDSDWDSCVWRSDDRVRTRRVLETWRAHFVHPDLPGRLSQLIEAAGLRLERLEAVPIVETSPGEDTYHHYMIPTIASFVRRHGLDREEAQAWANDVRRERPFFSLCRYLAVAVRPSQDV